MNERETRLQILRDDLNYALEGHAEATRHSMRVSGLSRACRDARGVVDRLPRPLNREQYCLDRTLKSMGFPSQREEDEDD